MVKKWLSVTERVYIRLLNVKSNSNLTKNSEFRRIWKLALLTLLEEKIDPINVCDSICFIIKVK